jgi:hypothetical protein
MDNVPITPALFMFMLMYARAREVKEEVKGLLACSMNGKWNGIYNITIPFTISTSSLMHSIGIISCWILLLIFRCCVFSFINRE